MWTALLAHILAWSTPPYVKTESIFQYIAQNYNLINIHGALLLELESQNTLLDFIAVLWLKKSDRKRIFEEIMIHFTKIDFIVKPMCTEFIPISSRK